MSCPTGQFSAPGSVTCWSPGTYTPVGTANTTQCPPNTFSSEPAATNASTCAPCPADFASAAGATSCYSTAAGCAAGSYEATATPQTCLPCAAGTFSSSSAATFCSPCAAGTYSSEGATTCSVCPVGSFCPGGVETPCPLGTFGVRPGKVSQFEACENCPAGTFQPSFRATSPAACVACSAGSFSAAPASPSCTACAPGTANPLVGQTAPQSCLPCSPASFTGLPGQGACTSTCPAGFIGGAAGQASLATACSPCPLGTYSSFAGSLRCTPCPPGQFAAETSASYCDSCPAGFFSNLPAATSLGNCSQCAAGSYNPAPGQTFAGCVPCPAGTASAAPGASDLVQCAPCAAGTFAPAGSVACAIAPAGTFAGAGAGAVEECPLGTFSVAAGAVSVVSCAPCPAGTTTATKGASNFAQCLKGALVCPPGTQPAPSSIDSCVALACAAPLRPAAWAASSNDASALLASTDCAGCAPGTAGTPGACLPCAPGDFCPGLLSRPLLNFSAGAAPPSGRALFASRPLPWGACPKLSAPLRGAATAAGGASLSRALQATTAGGVFLAALLLLGLSTLRAPPPQSPRTCAFRAAGLARGLDMYSLSHYTDVEKSPVNRPTAAGGVFTLLGLTGVATYAAYMVLQWQDSNTLVQRSLDAVDGDVWGAARALPGAAAPLPGAPAATGLLLRLTLDGEPGACAAPLAPPTASGLLRGGWARVGAVANCGGGSGASQLTYACADCDLGPAAALSFSFHYSCQSLLVEAAAVPAYPEGAATVLVADAGATAAAGSGLLAAVTWEAPPMLTLCTDDVGGATRRGYALTLAAAAPQRLAPMLGEGGSLLIHPAAAALNVTIALPLLPTFAITSLTPLVPWTQLLANIVGLSGVLSVVGVLFGCAEKRLRVKGLGAPPPDSPAAAAAAAAAASTTAEAVAALHKRLAALEGRATQHPPSSSPGEGSARGFFPLNPPRPQVPQSPGAGSARGFLLLHPQHPAAAAAAGGGGGGAPLSRATSPRFLFTNPLPASVAARRGAAAAPTLQMPRRWRRCVDATDVWYVAEDDGESAWEVPEGGEVA